MTAKPLETPELKLKSIADNFVQANPNIPQEKLDEILQSPLELGKKFFQLVDLQEDFKPQKRLSQWFGEK